MKETNEYHAIGVMSGTSLDGLDIAYCRFTKKDVWQWRILDSTTIPYSDDWKIRLQNATEINAAELTSLDHELGRYIGQCVKDFLKTTGLPLPLFVASHGHTVFHNPGSGYTLQIGCGADISVYSGCMCINDFRSVDVALGGQGAPLAPVGDRLLFGEYDACINLGGIANISFERNGERIAYDICPVNMALNYLAGQMGLDYDENGSNAAKGEIDHELLQNLGRLVFYQKKPPRSLGREWFEESFLPVIRSSDADIPDKLRTVTEHIAMQIGSDLRNMSNVLFTGGGTYNKFLLGRISNYCSAECVVPGNLLIDQKEALIFALLGVLRHRGEVNCLRSVTGAKLDSSGGSVWNPLSHIDIE